MLHFDHAIIAVADLHPAIADFQALGFNTFFGGQHADGKTHNGLIVFADGGYLELLAPTSPELISQTDTAGRGSFLDLVARGDGWAGFALLADDIDAAAAAIRERNLPISDPIPNSRLRPDGERLAWRTISIDGSRVPFLITDDTPRVLRVPDDADKIAQPNGVTGVAGLTIAVQNLDDGVKRYQAILGVKPVAEPAMPGAATMAFDLDGFRVTVAAPADAGSPLHDYIQQRGEVPYAIQLRSASADHTGLLDLAQAHDARIELVR